jgi:hypothetical protein
MGKSQLDGNAPLFFLLQPVRVDPREGFDEGSLPVVDVTGGPQYDLLHFGLAPAIAFSEVFHHISQPDQNSRKARDVGPADRTAEYPRDEKSDGQPENGSNEETNERVHVVNPQMESVGGLFEAVPRKSFFI